MRRLASRWHVVLLVLLLGAGLDTRADAASLRQRTAIGWSKLKLNVKKIARRTSVEVSFGLTFAPSKLANLSVGGSVWSGDRMFWAARSRYNDSLFNPRVQLGTAFGAFTRNRLAGNSYSLSPIPFVSGYYAPSGRSYGVSIGIPNLTNIGIGEVRSTQPNEYARGSYVGIGGALSLFGALNLSLGLTVYSPIFDPLAKPMAKPARKLKHLSDKAGALVTKAQGHLKRAREKTRDVLMIPFRT